MKIVFFGTSEFAVPALKKLADSNYEIVAVITQPDKPAGRKQRILPSPVKVEAEKLRLRFFQPTSPLSPPQAWGGIDISIVASYGVILPKSMLDAPRLGTLNIHPSLLPKYRGPSPIHAAILNGDKETGVSIIKLDEQLDHGSIVAQAKYEMRNTRCFYKELHDELAWLGAELLIKTLPDYVAGKIKPVPQGHAKATFTKLITKADARIDWSKSADEIDRLVRAYSAWPVAWTMLDSKRLKIYDAEAATPPSDPLSHAGEGGGEVLDTSSGKIVVQTGSGPLEITELQLEGGQRMPAKDFLNGYPNLEGKILK